MITAAEARRRVEENVTQEDKIQMAKIENSLDNAIRSKVLSFTYSGKLSASVKAWVKAHNFSIKEHEEDDHGRFYYYTIISF
jgi:O-methyltransferase involved in polyketide biosynthesis